MDLEVLGY